MIRLPAFFFHHSAGEKLPVAEFFVAKSSKQEGLACLKEEGENMYGYPSLIQLSDDERKIPEDSFEAIRIYREKAYDFYLGRGEKQNFKTAVEWFEKAGQRGDVVSLYILSDCCRKGKGVDASYAMSKKWRYLAEKYYDVNAFREYLEFSHLCTQYHVY